ncbi:hypothetical protein [Rhizohabitans arisaemae]|uniref:hypothetical protein n=1 Tax=Rhizohabitans arisaemae TaxID=2720610 RepID=UPI0024B10E42|nr:hypothetical protein [Rhizohabitans arisaemae]
MVSGIEILGILIAVSGGMFIVIGLLVVAPTLKRSQESRVGSLPLWFNGPGGAEEGVGTSRLVLTDRPAHWAAGGTADWTELARTAEPARGTGGASAGW